MQDSRTRNKPPGVEPSLGDSPVSDRRIEASQGLSRETTGLLRAGYVRSEVLARTDRRSDSAPTMAITPPTMTATVCASCQWRFSLAEVIAASIVATPPITASWYLRMPGW